MTARKDGKQVYLWQHSLSSLLRTDREKQQAVALQASTKLDFQLVIKFHRGPVSFQYHFITYRKLLTRKVRIKATVIKTELLFCDRSVKMQ